MTSEVAARWTELLRRLRDEDAHERAVAAVGVSAALGEEGAPPLVAILDELAKSDAAHPGVADSFYGAWLYGARNFASDAEQDAVKHWLLRVLGARAPGVLRTAPHAVEGNDLEFYAHELFEADPGALTTLLGWGYVDVVTAALDHCALRPSEWIPLVEAAYGRTRERSLLVSLATQHGVLHDDLLRASPSLVLPDGQKAVVLGSENARFWEARWIFPPRPAKLDFTEPRELFASLLATGMSLGSSDAPFDPKLVSHLAFPALPNTRRVAAMVRVDAQLMLALRGTHTMALRVVRTKPAG